MKGFIGLWIFLIVVGCSPVQQNQIVGEYLKWKQEVGYQPGEFIRHYDKDGSFQGYTFERRK
jgi:hypothetical protein